MAQTNILVTGAAGEIGQAIAIALTRPDTTLVLAAHDGIALEALSASIVAAGGSASIVCCDVTLEADVRRLFTTACLGRPIDLVVNAAGLTAGAPPPSQQRTARLWEHHTGPTGVALVCTYAARHLRPGGMIVNIAPALAQAPGATEKLSQVSQQAFLEWNTWLRQELQPSGIQVMVVTPAIFEGDDASAVSSDGSVSPRAMRIAQAVVELVGCQLPQFEESLRYVAEQIALPIGDRLNHILGPRPSRERILIVAEALQTYANALQRLATAANLSTRAPSASYSDDDAWPSGQVSIV